MLTEFDEIEEILRSVFEQARQDIIANHELAGQVASGRTKDSLKVEVFPGVSEYTATLFGREFFGALETGSRPWKKQYKHPPKPFVDVIRQWMADKGISGVSAYLVARKIMLEGSKLYRDGGREDIFTPVLQEVEEKLSQEISKIFDVITTKTIERL